MPIQVSIVEPRNVDRGDCVKKLLAQMVTQSGFRLTSQVSNLRTHGYDVEYGTFIVKKGEGVEESMYRRIIGSVGLKKTGAKKLMGAALDIKEMPASQLGFTEWILSPIECFESAIAQASDDPFKCPVMPDGAKRMPRCPLLICGYGDEQEYAPRT